MVNTPPPPNPAPQPGDGSATNQGHIDRDVNSILANLNHEQLASIVAAARASEHGNQGDSNSFAGVDASSILAALPPGIGQAASALTSFASSFKRSSTTDREDGEGVDGDQNDDEEIKKDQEAVEGHYEQHHPEDSHLQGGDEYQDEAAAIAAMSSLSAQTMQDQKPSGSRNKKESGPEAERARKDQHKEVERKRRELISNGITELAAIVPGCDAKGVNKTAIINAAVRYIQELKNNEASNIEKWTLEKLLMDQAMNDLTQHLDASRKQVVRLQAELGIEMTPDEIKYQGILDSTREHHDDSLDPDLQNAAREGAAADALSEVAAAAAAAAAANDTSHASAEDLAEAAVEQATEEKKSEGGRGRGRARPEAVIKEETARSKRSRQM